MAIFWAMQPTGGNNNIAIPLTDHDTQVLTSGAANYYPVGTSKGKGKSKGNKKMGAST
jgi:hypothetical protein